MRKNIEVEIRGPLKREEFVRLKRFLSMNGKKGRSGKRLSLMYFRGAIPRKSDEIKNEKVDLRLRITNRKPELVMKYGIWGGSDARKEFSFAIKNGQFTEWIEFLKCLDWTVCVAYGTRHESFIYEGIEFTLVEIVNVGYSYEAEILCEDNPVRVKAAKKKIGVVCEKLKLREYRSGEFEAQCDKINNTKEIQYDFRNINSGIIKERFREFF